MSRYRSEIPTLEARARELAQQLAELDRDEGVGVYAPSHFARGMYWLGLKVGGGARAALGFLGGERRARSEVERLRARIARLARALEARRPPPL
jgi:hypothetical protein